MTDGMEHGDEAPAPGPDAPNNQATTPPVLPAQPLPPSGYGYPPRQAFPAAVPPQGFGQPFAPSSNEPDWEAMANAEEVRLRRRKWMWTGGIVLGACVLGGIVGTAVIEGMHHKPTPIATGTAGPGPHSTVPVNSPTAPGKSNVLADHAGQADITLSPDASVDPVQNGGFALRMRANSNSYAQSASSVVDVTKSFTVSAWVYNETPTGYRSVISQGDGLSYSFDLGRDDFGGKTVWIFRAQTADGGSDATSYHALSPSMDTVGKWVLLTGVYDSTQNLMTLYVDGQSVASTKVPALWNAPGPLQLGRNRNHSAWGGYWAGVIGHVQIWNKPLTAAQITSLKDSGSVSDSVPIGSWLVG